MIFSVILSLAFIKAAKSECGSFYEYPLDSCQEYNNVGVAPPDMDGMTFSYSFSCEDDIYTMYYYNDSMCEVEVGSDNVTAACDDDQCVCGDPEDCDSFTVSFSYECEESEWEAGLSATKLFGQCVESWDEGDYVYYGCPENYQDYQDGEVEENYFCDADCEYNLDDLYETFCESGPEVVCDSYFQGYPTGVCAEVYSYGVSVMYSCNGTGNDTRYFETTYFDNATCSGDSYTMEVTSDCEGAECSCSMDEVTECTAITTTQTVNCDIDQNIEIISPDACVYYFGQSYMSSCGEDGVETTWFFDDKCECEEQVDSFECTYVEEPEDDCGYYSFQGSLPAPMDQCIVGLGQMPFCDEATETYYMAYYDTDDCTGGNITMNITDDCVNDPDYSCQCGSGAACDTVSIDYCVDEEIDEAYVINQCVEFPFYDFSFMLSCNATAQDIGFEFDCAEDTTTTSSTTSTSTTTTEYPAYCSMESEEWTCNENENADDDECGWYFMSFMEIPMALGACQQMAFGPGDASAFMITCDNGTYYYQEYQFSEEDPCSNMTMFGYELDECDEYECNCPSDPADNSDYCSTIEYEACDTSSYMSITAVSGVCIDSGDGMYELTCDESGINGTSCFDCELDVELSFTVDDCDDVAETDSPTSDPTTPSPTEGGSGDSASNLSILTGVLFSLFAAHYLQ